MGETYLFLSPHYDDVVYSCGGALWALAERGDRALIVTICGGDPPVDISAYAQSLHDRWGMPDPKQVNEMVALRREEDRTAAALCRAEVDYWEIPDCIYRADRDGGWLYNSDQAIFGELQVGDMLLIDEMVIRLNRVIDTLTPALVIAPLAIGNHVDHQLVRLAAEQVAPQRLSYYADYPYVRDPIYLQRLKEDPHWRAEPTFQLPPAAIDARIAGMTAYQSQLSTFWQNEAELDAEIRGSMTKSGNIESFWTPH